MFSGGFSTKDFLRPTGNCRGAVMTCRIYSTDEYKQYADRIAASQSFVTADEIKTIPGGLIIANGRHSNGVYDRMGRYERLSDVTKGKYWHHRVCMPWRRAVVRYMDMDVMYMGRIHWSFGHFLLEHTNRMWAIGQRKVDKYVFIHDKLTKGRVPDFVYKFMEMAGIAREDIIVVDKDTCFRNVFVPAAASGRAFTSDEWGRAFDAMTKKLGNSGGGTYHKVYLSRCALPTRTVFGEEKIQSIFQKNGFEVVYPEKLPLESQARLIAGADVLAGCAGTALHLALFMKPGGTVIQIKRNSKTDDNFPAQNLINNTKRLNGVFVQASIETSPTEHSTFEPQLIGVNDNMRRFFKDFGFVCDAGDLAPDRAAMHDYQQALDAWCAAHPQPTRWQKFIKKIKKI